MRAYLRPGTWAAMFAAVLVCLLAAVSATGAAPTAQPDLKPILLTDPVPDPRQDGVLYFPQTGHTLRGPFLRYWQEHGGLAQFGYPLTEEFFEPSGPDNVPLQVQYFERNRFEMHPENAGTPHEVLLGTLGREFRPQDPPAPQQPDALYFTETGHNLSGTFRQYWESHGGLFVHGYPITEPAMERSTNGKDYLVQWFERSRFELHPENTGSEYEVLLGLLGRQLSEKKGYPYGWYPAFGRAVDWSWVAGRLRAPMMCAPADCGCPAFAWSNSDTFLAPNGKALTEALANGVGGARRLLVLFGKQGDFTELDPICKPNYVVLAVQPNPAN